MLKPMTLCLALIAATIGPSSSARAGIIFFGVPTSAAPEAAWATLGFAGFSAITTICCTDKQDKWIGWIATGISITLGESAKHFEESIQSAVPLTPNFLLSRIAKEFELAAKSTEASKGGFKLIILPGPVTNSILEEASYLDQETLRKLRALMRNRTAI